ncbi:MAG TPA: hypothetical protein VFQ74_08990 [Pseudolysinimonas sp.]|nr:hypothetical protein [Pseudolysinimonas sp.]
MKIADLELPSDGRPSVAPGENHQLSRSVRPRQCVEIILNRWSRMVPVAP